MSEDTLKAWRANQEQAMRDLGNEGAGAYAGCVLRWSHIHASPFLSELIANWAVDVWRLVKIGGQDRSALCLCCDAELPPAKAAAFWLLHAARDEIKTASVTPVCESCAARKSDAELVEDGFQLFQKMSPDARKLASEHFYTGGSGHG
jgi:hypothetical protein